MNNQKHSTAENAGTSSTRIAPAKASASVTTNCGAALHHVSTPTQNRKRVYISIPISGLPIGPVREKADLIKASLSRLGFEPVSPFDIYAGAKPTYEDYICCDLRAMLDCDAVYFCHGWRDSCGCNIEHDVALRYIKFNKKQFKLMYE